MSAQRLADVAQVEEQETLWKGEVLLQQAEALEAGQRLRQQRLVVFEAGRLDAVGVDRFVPGGRPLRRHHQHAQRVAADQLVQAVGHVVDAAAMQPQVAQRDLREVGAGGRAHAQAQARAVAAPLRHGGQGQVGGLREVLDLRDLERPQRQLVRGAELAGGGGSGAGLAVHDAAAGELDASGEARVGQVGVDLRDQHRRRRRQELRIDDLQQALREARELGVDLELDAAGQKRKPLQQPFDIGVGDLEAFETEPRRDLGKLLRELGPHLAQVAQFLVVVAQQPRVHGSALGPVNAIGGLAPGRHRPQG